VLINPGKHPFEVKQDIAHRRFFQEHKSFLKPPRVFMLEGFDAALAREHPDDMLNGVLWTSLTLAEGIYRADREVR
jgi:hypothetical protein